MEFIEINGNQMPFRFGLRALKQLEALVGLPIFEKIIKGEQPSFGESITLAEAILYIGLKEGSRKEGMKFTMKKIEVEDILDEGGTEFLEVIMGMFEKAVSSPK
jgi:hypothetical protein